MEARQKRPWEPEHSPLSLYPAKRRPTATHQIGPSHRGLSQCNDNISDLLEVQRTPVSESAIDTDFCRADLSDSIQDHTSDRVDQPDIQIEAFNLESEIRNSWSPQGYSMNDEVFFGMICDVQISLRKDKAKSLSDHSRTFAPDGHCSFLVFRIFVEHNRCNILSDDGFDIAALNMKASLALVELSRSKSLRYEGFVPIQCARDPVKSSHGGTLWITTIDINVYGKREFSEEIARCLCKAGLFLQDPHWKPATISYENPQYFDLPEFRHESREETHPSNLTQETADPADGIGDFQQDYGLLFDKFAHDDCLVQAKADAKITTDLLSHQKQGLDFIMRRESSSRNSSQALWEKQESDGGEPLYQHVITGAKSSNPDDALGGILADDMGLGKTLTMLSAVVGSLGHDGPALHFALKNNLWSPGNEKAMIAAQSTLLIVPSALLIDNWIDEINKHVCPGSLDYFKYHGQSRNIQLPHLLQYGIVLTTYGTVAAELGRKQNLLHRISWYRIVLDEGHVIRNPSTKQFRSITSLRSHIRWCLSGTPIQNSLDDLGSLVRFLKLPYLEDSSQFRRHITKKIQQSKTDLTRDFRSLRILLRAICLRRNRTILPLPDSKEDIHYLEFSANEREEYNRLLGQCESAIKMAVGGHKAKVAHQTVLEALLRLRLFCNNGSQFATSDSNSSTDFEYEGSLLQQNGQAFCHYCRCDILSFSGLGDEGSGYLTKCRHLICAECVSTYKQEYELASKCSICHASHGSLGAKTHDRSQNSVLSGSSYPSKIMALYRDIVTHKNEGKSIVFSFWKKSLDIVKSLFQEKRISYLRVDGSLSFSKRKIVLGEFLESQQGSILLMTLGTGAVGLNNLSVANRVHILEPQWNPSVENQAIGRVIRLGQSKPVQIVRYITKRTVEKNVQSRQQLKLNLARGGFTQMVKNMISSASC